MSDPITTTGGAIIGSKITAILYALGGALITLAFYEPVERQQTRWKMYLLAITNVVMTWFIGYTLGAAINQYLGFTGAIANGTYTGAAIIGLLLVGAFYKMAEKFHRDPEGTIKGWHKKD